MGLSVVARRLLRAGAIIALTSVTAFGVAAASATVGSAPARGVSSIPAAPIPANPNLGGVSCPAVSMCLVVGEAASDPGFVPLAATWNGRTWRWLAQPPEPQADSSLGAVTCLSVTRCIAIGNTDATGSTGKGVAFGEEWNGAAWQMMAPLAGTTFTSALGLSCVTAAYCVAVGGSRGSPPLAHAVAEFWNGVSWSRLTPVIPAGAKTLTFDGVSCASESHCLAVGSYRARSREFGVAESWNGSTWTMQAVPAGIPAISDISCPRATLCLAVVPGGPALLWRSGRWRKLAVPGLGDLVPSLNGVTCTSATRCIAVGGSNFVSVVYGWTGGTSLTMLPVPNSPGLVAALSAISCASSSSCLAVGNPSGQFTSGGNIAAAWNGRTWRAIRENRSDSLAAVSCLSISRCLAVGRYVNTGAFGAPLAETWDGTAWHEPSQVDLFGAFSGVSCLSASFCLAAGLGISATWSGSGWQVANSGTDNLQARPTVSCGSTGFCAASGNPRGMVRWDGLVWHEMNFKLPAFAASGELSAVSCTGPTFCLAVGAYSRSSGGEPSDTLVNIWNGRRWTLAGTPHPGIDSLLNAVSCVPGSGCMAIGNYIDAGQVAHNLAMRFSGGTWQVVTMPGGFGPVNPNDPSATAGPTSVSCSSAMSCVAVGSFPDSQQPELAEVWNGSTWQVTTPVGPPTGLASVSCPSPTFCMAVGADGNRTLTESWNGHAWTLLTEPNP